MHQYRYLPPFILLLGLAACTSLENKDLATTPYPDTIHVASPSGVDDRDILLEAFKKAGEGAVLQFAPGTYVVGGKIQLTQPGIVLTAHPDGTIIRGCDPENFTDPVQAILNCGSFELAGPDQQVRGFTIEYTWHGLLTGCCFPENMEDLESGNTFRADYPGGQIIENNHFRYNSTGIRAFGLPAKQVVIRGNTFSDNYHGVTVNGSGVLIQRNRFEANEPEKVPVIGYPDNAIGILSFHSLRPGSAFLDNCRENIVEGNIIRGIPAGIYITTYEDGEVCSDNVIKDNDILMTPVPHRVSEAGLDPVITNVNDPLVAGLPIALDNQSVTARIERTLITGNRIRNASGLGIQLLRASGSQVTENEILSVMRRDPFPGNSLRATPWEAANGSGIWVSPGSRDNQIAENIFQDIANVDVHNSQ